MQKDIKLLDLFSGTGGFALGLKQAGFNIIKHQFSEIDKHAIANYKHNFKNAEYIGSITDVSGSRGQSDIITFGSPCQDFSLAGKRKGIEGERSSLIMEAIRLISEIQPSVFIWENVKGTFSSNNGEDFWAILNAFTNIGRYRLEWQLLNTSWFLPQNRERIYLVGHLAGSSKPGVFPITKTHQKTNTTQPTQNNKVGTLMAGYGKIPTDGTYIQVKPIQNPDRKQKQQNGRRIKNTNEPSFTISATDTQGVVIGTLRTHNDGKGFRKVKQNISPTIPARAREDGSGQPVIKVTGGTQKNAGQLTNKSTALTSAMGEGGGHIPIVNQIRRLTEIECERLQGFPDNWTKYGFYNNVKKEIPKTQRYKLIGNAVTVNVVKEVTSRLHINN
ncbi:DNA (cytosine-5-)-methyltransferase [Mesoflavibacter sp. CH_XMU1404-2]|uniref:DNA cytosine methyltransferase n=1 Tax=Mesoflavibacter sp. CH_XMU1404-2 TaxID=3107766 RepID=UPI00300A0463